MTEAIGVEVECSFTPSMLKKVVYAGSQSASFAQATEDLEALAEVNVSREQARRWTNRVGEERVAEVQAEAEAYQALPLPQRRENPQEVTPQVACVMMDGGRIQVRDRAATEPETKGHWKESLVGCCLSMVSQEHPNDPSPIIPSTFVDPTRMGDLSREIKGFVGDREIEEEASEEIETDRVGRPEFLVRSVVATRGGLAQFGKRLVSQAYSRGFHASARRAFVADGAASNWSVHKQHFASYTPIVDFTHVICYVYAAAMAGRAGSVGWDVYLKWAQWLWEGSIDRLIEAIAIRAEQLGTPSEGDDSSPAAIVARTLKYLKNQQTRMRYDEYRRLGLPITSSHIESTIKRVNRRVKGTEKFWDQGAEPILQLVADQLSETDASKHFWNNRSQRLQTHRCYQTAA